MHKYVDEAVTFQAFKILTQSKLKWYVWINVFLKRKAIELENKIIQTCNATAKQVHDG